jgi:heptosyltransferase III
MLLWAPGATSDPRHPGDDAKATQLMANDIAGVRTPDLRTLVAALSLADKVICPDGGAMHVAAALGKPIVALFGDSPVERWRPWSVAHSVVQPDSRHISDAAVADVLGAR